MEEAKLYRIDKGLYDDDRYRKHRRYLDDNGVEIQETYEDIDFEERSNDQFHEVASGEENSLDLISHQYYNNEDLWWVIAEASNIDNPMSVEVGTVLRIPDISTLYGLRGVLS